MKPGDVFSKRRRSAEGGTPEVYEYDNLPQGFRVQVIHILADALGDSRYGEARERWQAIHDQAAREAGKLRFGDLKALGPQSVLTHYLTEGAETKGPGKSFPTTDQALDLIEIAFRFVVTEVRGFDRRQGEKISPTSAIEELNLRFREHSLGYQCVDGQLIRIDSQFIHSEVVLRALTLLKSREFAGPEEEFRKAHQEYRDGNTKQAIAEALKAFESTLKTICHLRRWDHKPTDSAKALIDLVIRKGLVPESLTSFLGGVRAVLEGGLPTLRNRTKGSGHGQGPQPVDVPAFVAAFALHLAAATIVFIVEAHNESG